MPPHGGNAAMQDQWNTVALLSALLTGIAAGGMFSVAPYITMYKDDDNSAGYLISMHQMSKVTMMGFCVSTYVFLMGTFSSAFFVSFASRNQAILPNAEDLRDKLGALYHVPQIALRTGYFFLLLSFCAFFILVMSAVEMMGCLIFCGLFFIAPTFLTIVRAGSITMEEVLPFHLSGSGRLSPSRASSSKKIAPSSSELGDGVRPFEHEDNSVND